ncbi:MAG TPA: hypothetical protein VHQ95_16130, partial [Pyrinomonadaceae bacterium]|nr:hypothetical protein [Pyrinomonadaceae bacterium]
MTYFSTERSVELPRAPTARDVKAWANGPGGECECLRALKARNENWQIGSWSERLCGYLAPSALGVLTGCYLGRCPRLLHCAPLALIQLTHAG